MPLFPFQQAQFAQVFPLKPALFQKVFAGLGNTNKSATFLLLLLDSRSVLATLSSSPFFLLPQFLWQTWRELSSLSSCSITLQWVPGHSFLPGNDAADELADEERYSRPLQSLVISLLLSFVSTLLYPRTGGVLSHRNSLTHKLLDFHRGTCAPLSRSLCSLVYAATDTAYCHAPISLGLAESRILPATPADTRPRTPLISLCTVQQRTLCAAHSLATLCLSTTSGARP